MAITVSDTAFGTIVIPGAYPRINVRTPAAGLGAFGIVAIVGEADEGPGTGDTDAGEDIEANFYAPTQIGNIIAKYGSGNIVEAFKAIAAPSNDPLITGSVTRIYVYKTNNSTSATSSISSITGTYADLEAQSQGILGNQVRWGVSTATSAVAPTTGEFSYVPVPTSGTSALLKYRLNGGTESTGTISANQAPSTVASNLSSGDLLVTGGSDRSAVAGLAGVVLTLTASGSTVALQLAGANVFPVTPVVGDLMVLPSNSLYGASADSAFAGTGGRNLGAYVITGVSNVTNSAVLNAVKLANNAATSLTTPANVQTTFSATVTNDVQIYSPLKFTNMSGVNRSSLVNLTGSGMSLTASGSSLRLNVLSSQIFDTGANEPKVGDSLYVPSGSALAGAGSANVGWYAVTTVNNVTSNCYLVASRLSNGSPVNVVSATITSSPDADLKVVRPWIDGQRACLEVMDNGGTTSITATFVNLGLTSSASFISTAAAPVVTEGTDYECTVSINRSVDNVQESYVGVGGNAVLELGYLGTTASVNVSDTSLVFTVTGGAGADLTVNYSNFPNLTSLAEYVSTQTGYSATVSSNAFGALSPSVLDQGTYTLCTSSAASARPCVIKKDVYDFEQAIAQSPTVSAEMGDGGLKGLPEPTSVDSFFTGGAKNGTTGAAFNSAVDELAKINCNFVIPLFSRDATDDIADDLTESSSTYTISAINAYVKSHCIAMSTPKRKKHRLGMCSFKGTFANGKIQAQNLASARTALMIQDVKAVGMDGSITQFQPWYGAVVAGGMQAIGLYRSISRKFANISGIVNPSGFSPKDDGQLEDALNCGILVLESPPTGGFRFVSDQTTYGKDSNFVYNSLQVMYTSDFMAVDLANSFDNFAVGQAISDISAGAALVFLQTKMGQYFNNKLIAPSGNSTAGYDSATVTIDGPVMRVGVNAYVTNAISFVLISFDVSQVSQSAS
jgi:hypothetical protein